MLNTGFSPWPSYSEEEVKIISDILRSNRVNYWTGEHGKSFEKEFAAWCGTKYAVALSNGTVALEVALRAMGIGLVMRLLQHLEPFSYRFCNCSCWGKACLCRCRTG